MNERPPYELTVSVSIRSNEGHGSLNVYETVDLHAGGFPEIAAVLRRFHDLGKRIRFEAEDAVADAQMEAEFEAAEAELAQDQALPESGNAVNQATDQAAAPRSGYGLKDVQAEMLADLAAEILEAFPFQAGGCKGPGKCLNCRGR